MDLHNEFLFFQARLLKIANLHRESGNESEVAFMIGCLYTIAQQHAERYKEINERTEK